MLGVQPTVLEGLYDLVGELTERRDCAAVVARRQGVLPFAQQIARGLGPLPNFLKGNGLRASKAHLAQLLSASVPIDEHPTAPVILADRELQAASVAVSTRFPETAYLQRRQLV